MHLDAAERPIKTIHIKIVVLGEKEFDLSDHVLCSVFAAHHHS